MRAPGPAGALVAEVRRCVESGDPDGVVRAVLAVPPDAREAAAQALERATSRDVDGRSAGWAAGVALALAGLDAAAADAAGRLVWLWSVPHDDPFLDPERWADVVVPRGRVWCRRLCRSLLSGESVNAGARWRWVDALVRRGVVEPPTQAAGVLWVLEQPAEAIRGRLLAGDRVEGLIHVLLRTPGVGPVLRRAGTSGPWSDVLTILRADTPEGRARVLDDVVAGLSGALPGTDADGLVRLLDALDPTPEELAPHATAVVELLVAQRATVAAAARRHLPGLLAAGVVDGEALLAVTPEVLARRETAAVTAQLALLRAGLSAGVLDAAGSARAAVGGLDPARADVAVAVGRFLAEAVQNADDGVVADVRAEFGDRVPEPWDALRRAVGPRLVPAPGASTDAASPGARLAPAPTPRPVPVDLPEPGRVEPVADLDEMIELAARVLDDPLLSALDAERAIDGMVRLRGLPPGVVRSFAERGEHLWVPYLGDRYALVALVMRWAGLPWHVPDGVVVTGSGWVGRPADAPPGVEVEQHDDVVAERDAHGQVVTDRYGMTVWRRTPRWMWRRRAAVWTPSALVQRRLAEAGALATGAPGPALSLPSREDGTVDIDAFLARSHERAAAGLPFFSHDVGTALLRLRPSDRGRLLAGDLAPGTRSALELLERPTRWVRGPAVLDPYPGTEPTTRVLWTAEGPPSGSPDDPVRGWLDTSTVPQVWGHLGVPDEHGPGVHDVMELWALTLPGRPDVVAAHLQSPLVRWADSAPADLSAVVRSFGRSPVPLGGPSLSALLWASASRSAPTRAAAAESLAAAARTGMLSGPVLGAELASLVGPEGQARPDGSVPHMVLPGVPTVSRIAATLTDAASIDERAEVAVLDAVLACADVLPDVRQGFALLEVAVQVATRRRAPVRLPERLGLLAAGRSTTRLAQAARRLAEVGTSG